MARQTLNWKTVATLTVHDLSNMETRQVRCIRDWLRRLADDIGAHPQAYSKRFTARYHYVPRKEK